MRFFAVELDNFVRDFFIGEPKIRFRFYDRRVNHLIFYDNLLHPIGKTDYFQVMRKKEAKCAAIGFGLRSVSGRSVAQAERR